MIKDNQSIVLRLWGKSSPFHPLICHMLDVGCTLEVLLNESTFSHISPRTSSIFGIDKEKLIGHLVVATTLHDIGKCHPLFQQKQMGIDVVQDLDSMKKLQPGDLRNYRHEEYALLWVCNTLKEQYGWDISSARLIGQVMACHHQHERGCEPQTSIDDREWWKELQKDLTELIIQIFSPTKVNISQCFHYDVAGTLLLGLVILADWIASNPKFFPPVNQVTNIDQYIQTSRQHALNAIARLGFNRSLSHAEVPLDFCAVWPNIKPESIRVLQSSCESLIKTKELTPGLMIIEAPMGEGKTEAALYTALQWIRMASGSGIYIALPTAATSNQMYGRVENFIQNLGCKEPIRLLHGMAWLLDEDTPRESPNLMDEEAIDPSNCKTNTNDAEIAAEWFRPAKRGLLAPWAVGTVDQAMMAALKVRYGVLRWAGLSGKVLILDEVHAYDSYMITIIKRLLVWCGVLNIPVILLSATLPQELRRELMNAYTGKSFPLDSNESAYPLITHVNQQDKIKFFPVTGVHTQRQVRLEVLPLLGKWEQVAALAVGMVEKGGCLCIVVNTVSDAQQLYVAIKKQVFLEKDIRLFHARFKAGRRQEIEQYCLDSFDKRSLKSVNDPEYKSRPSKVILVATQVVEQSLDLDFDAMISAIAPIDLLLQRSGRLHRHDGRRRPQGLSEPTFHVLIPEVGKSFETTGKVYEPWILKKTVEVLQGRKNLMIPVEVRDLIENVYSSQAPEMEHPNYNDWLEMKQNQKKDEEAAKIYLIPPPDARRFWMGRDQLTFDEEEDGGKWFSAKTRLGDATKNVLILDEDQVINVEKRMKHLTLAEGRELLKKSVALRSYVIDGVTPAEDFAKPVKGKGLLSGFYLLPMRDGQYRFIREEKYEYVVIDDHELGILIERMG